MRLIWSPRAPKDVERLYQFLKPKNAMAARRAVSAIRQAVRPLPDHPEMSRLIEDTPSGFREWSVPFGQSGYVIFYQVEIETIVILAVKHMSEAGY